MFQRLFADAGTHRSILVVGLGRFGGALAQTLESLGHEVLGVDLDPITVAAFRDELTHVVEADCTRKDTLEELDAREMAHAVVAIGTDVEASVLTAMALLDIGVKDVWAKALGEQHAQILNRIGVHHVVTPEIDMGRRVAHLITGEASDYLQLDDSFALAETDAPIAVCGQTLADAGIRARYNVTVVGIKGDDGNLTYATADTLITAGSHVLILGLIDDVDRFAALP